MAGEPVFVDTNVLVYATRSAATHHDAARRALAELEREGSTAWVSTQVLREYLAVVTRPQAAAATLPMTAAIADVRRFRTMFEVAEERPTTLDHLLRLLTAHRGAGRQVHDANIVATMIDYGIRRLLTFNTGDFRRFGRIVEIVPP